MLALSQKQASTVSHLKFSTVFLLIFWIKLAKQEIEKTEYI
jgi:hypothetical protein